MNLNEATKAMQTVLNDPKYDYAGPKLVVDGLPGPKTIAKLTKAMSQPPAVKPAPVVPNGTGDFDRAALADFAEELANLHIKEGTEKHKEIIKQFAEKPTSFGYGMWAWCAAFVTYCCMKVGLNIPSKAPSKFGYTFAYVEAWQQWAIEKGFYHDNDGKFVPQRGDITIFDWTQKSIDLKDTDTENHIGVHLKLSGKNFLVAEGNTSNQTMVRTRTSIQIQGWVRIPNGYKFS